jgi:hypothetical protein
VQQFEQVEEEEGVGKEAEPGTPIHPSSSALPAHDDEYLTLSHTSKRHNIPAAMIEMLPMEKNESRSSVAEGLVEAARDCGGPADGGCGREGVKSGGKGRLPSRQSLSSNEDLSSKQ